MKRFLILVFMDVRLELDIGMVVFFQILCYCKGLLNYNYNLYFNIFFVWMSFL